MIAPHDRHVRAVFDAETITVYQAYGDAIADAALAAGRFVSPFEFERMTWIKPSFLWMMYRSSWGRSPGQERVLAVRISREGFEWALARAVLSTFDSTIHVDQADWRREVIASSVRVQWDPDRSVTLARLNRRTIQVGLAGDATRRYASTWVVGIDEVTTRAHRMGALIAEGSNESASALAPTESVYPLPATIATRIGAGTGA
jgi:hypothetical protein